MMNRNSPPWNLQETCEFFDIFIPDWQSSMAQVLDPQRCRESLFLGSKKTSRSNEASSNGFVFFEPMGHPIGEAYFQVLQVC